MMLLIETYGRVNSSQSHYAGFQSANSASAIYPSRFSLRYINLQRFLIYVKKLNPIVMFVSLILMAEMSSNGANVSQGWVIAFLAVICHLMSVIVYIKRFDLVTGHFLSIFFVL